MNLFCFFVLPRLRGSQEMVSNVICQFNHLIPVAVHVEPAAGWFYVSMVAAGDPLYWFTANRQFALRCPAQRRRHGNSSTETVLAIEFAT